MKIQIDIAALRDALQKTATESRATTLPILKNALLNAQDNVLTITTTDTERTIERRVACAVSQPGAYTVDASKLKTVLSGLTGAVDIFSDREKVVAKSGRRKYVFDSLPAKDFPLPDFSGMELLEVDGEALGGAIRAVEHSSGNNDVRYYLNGVCVGDGCVVATDGHRISAVKMDTGFSREVIIPYRSRLDVADALHGGGQVFLSRQALMIKSEVATLHSTLIDCKFPDWRRACPSSDQFNTVITADKKEAMEAIQRMMPLAFTQIDKVRFHSLIYSIGEQVTLRTKTADGDDFIPVKSCDGEGGELLLKSEYVMSALKAVSADDVELHYASAEQAILLKAKNDNAYHYIMPMRM